MFQATRFRQFFKMTKRNWIITGVSSGFGYEMTRLLLARGQQVIGTVRKIEKVKHLIEQYPDLFHVEILDMTDIPSVHHFIR